MKLNLKSTAISASMLFCMFTGNSYSATFYGTLDLFTGSVKDGDTNAHTGVVDSSGLTTSFIGVKTDYDLGEGIKGLIVLESFLRPDTGAEGRFDGDTFYARDAYVGFEGGYGTLTVGRNTTPYFLSVILTNTFGGAFGFGPSIKHSFLGGLNGDSGWSNSILYSAPKAGGFQSSILYTPGEIPGEASTAKVGGNMFYSVGKLTTTLALQSADTLADDPTAAIGDTQRAGLLGAKYDLGSMTLSFQLSRMATKLAAGGTTDYKGVHAGVTVPMGKGKVLLSYAGTKIKDGGESNRKSGALGYLRDISDKINVYAVYYDESNSTKINNDTKLGFGARFSF